MLQYVIGCAVIKITKIRRYDDARRKNVSTVLIDDLTFEWRRLIFGAK